MTGTRGPVSGRGGRPTKTGRKSRSSKPAAKVAASDPVTPAIGGDPATWLEELADISWEKFVAYCGHWRPLDASDRVQVLKFWRIVQRYEKLSKHLAGRSCEEWFFETEKGHRGRAPELVELRTLEDAIHENATRFGLDPASRVRLGDDDGPKDVADPFVQYLKQGSLTDAQAKDAMRESAARSRTVRRPRAERKAAGGPNGKARTRKAQPRPRRTA